MCMCILTKYIYIYLYYIYNIDIYSRLYNIYTYTRARVCVYTHIYVNKTLHHGYYYDHPHVSEGKAGTESG